MKAPVNRTIPLYQRLIDDISARISAGSWAVGAKLPSERKLCDLYRVSQITVRRALRELAQAGYVYSHHGLGWFVGERAGGAGALRDVTLVIPALDGLTAQLVPHLAEALRPDLALRIAFCGNGQDACADAVRRVANDGAAAALLAVEGEERRLHDCYRAAVAGVDMPVALLWRGVPGVEALALAIDEEAATRRMTEYLLSMGHRRLAYVGDDPTLVHGQQRYRGFLGSLLEHGHELPMEWVFAGRLTEGTAGARFARMFGGATRPTAVVCGADERAAEALALLGRMGITCPDEVAVVGIDDAPYAELLSTPLTSYRFDLRALADASAAAVRALLAREAAQSVTVGGEVVRRASCGAAR